MENYFRELSQKLFSSVPDGEILLLNFQGEDSDFVRLNKGKLRQAGHVVQRKLRLDLVSGSRQSRAEINLSGELQTDIEQATGIVKHLRGQIAFLPKDPFLHYSTSVENSFHESLHQLPEAHDAVAHIISSAEGLDLVGIWASGTMFKGFANSLGQFNWHVDSNFNFDWSIYSHGDKAIKQNYAGSQWNKDFIDQKFVFARETLPLLGKKMKTITPGKYRVFLTPTALYELFELLNWGGFGMKSHKTSQTSLIKMVKENRRMNEQVSIVENHHAGMAPSFTQSGFLLPDAVPLISNGAYRHSLSNARSAKEYGAAVNCDIEHPCSLEMEGGTLHQDKVLSELDTGVYVSNLWYCNYSDRSNCCITGMTRFACLWVENGQALAPLSVMRFDESMLDMLGHKLVALTEEKEHILDASSYEHRSTTSGRLPGALIDDFTFTL